MLKKTVVILFVTTLVAFSLVTANIIAASNMSTSAYAKKGHSNSGGSSSSSSSDSSGDKSSKEDSSSGGRSSGGSSTHHHKSRSSGGSGSSSDGSNGGAGSGGGSSNTGSGVDNTLNKDTTQSTTPPNNDLTSGVDNTLNKDTTQSTTPPNNELTTGTPPIPPIGNQPSTPPDCTTNPNDPACQTQQQAQPPLPGLVTTPPPTPPDCTTNPNDPACQNPPTCPDGTRPDTNGKCQTTTPDNSTGGRNGSGSKQGAGILGTSNTTTTTDNGTRVGIVGGENGTLQNVTNPVSNITRSNATKSLSLSLNIDKNPIVRGNIQTITVIVSDKGSHDMVSGANVKVGVPYASGLTNKQFSGSTDGSGHVSFPWRIGGNSDPGVFKVKAEASKDGYGSASGEASFIVKCDTLSRGCNLPPPCPQTTGCHLSLSISVAKNPIVHGNPQTVTVTVSDKDSHQKIIGAIVKIIVTYVTGFQHICSGSTDGSGQAVCNWTISGDAKLGKFTVTARASKGAYASAPGSTFFNVISKPNPPLPPKYHDNNNGITGLSTTLQLQKYFKEFTDMPANSPLYITSTSMHKDTLGDIVITGEIKNRGTTTANFVELIATFYNINNQTLGNKNTFTDPTTLQPGQAAPFTVYLIPKDIPLNQINSVKYHLTWHGSTDKILPKTSSLKTATTTTSAASAALQPHITITQKR